MKTQTKKSIVFITLISFIILSCKVGPNFVRPVVDAPINYRTAANTDTTIANMAWWNLFQDTVLQNIVKTTLEIPELSFQEEILMLAIPLARSHRLVPVILGVTAIDRILASVDGIHEVGLV